MSITPKMFCSQTADNCLMVGLPTNYTTSPASYCFSYIYSNSFVKLKDDLYFHVGVQATTTLSFEFFSKTDVLATATATFATPYIQDIIKVNDTTVLIVYNESTVLKAIAIKFDGAMLTIGNSYTFSGITSNTARCSASFSKVNDVIYLAYTHNSTTFTSNIAVITIGEDLSISYDIKLANIGTCAYVANYTGNILLSDDTYLYLLKTEGTAAQNSAKTINLLVNKYSVASDGTLILEETNSTLIGDNKLLSYSYTPSNKMKTVNSRTYILSNDNMIFEFDYTNLTLLIIKGIETSSATPVFLNETWYLMTKTTSATTIYLYPLSLTSSAGTAIATFPYFCYYPSMGLTFFTEGNKILFLDSYYSTVGGITCVEMNQIAGSTVIENCSWADRSMVSGETGKTKIVSSIYAGISERFKVLTAGSLTYFTIFLFLYNKTTKEKTVLHSTILHANNTTFPCYLKLNMPNNPIVITENYELKCLIFPRTTSVIPKGLGDTPSSTAALASPAFYEMNVDVSCFGYEETLS